MDDIAARRAAGWFAGLALYLSLPAIAGAVTLRLSPNGVDDTPQLQAALESCSGAVTTCKIVLARGTFKTNLLLVSNFRGQIIGQGRGVTIVRPLLDRYLRPSLRPFDAPPTRSAPYPALLHFTNGGNIQINDLTLDFPWEMKVLPWYGNLWSTLLAAILVDGGATQNARLHVARIGVLAAQRTTLPTLTSNLLAAIAYGGKRANLPNGYATPGPDPLGSGILFVRNINVRTAGVGIAVHDARNLDARILDNDFVDTRKNAVSLFELGGSQVRVLGNRIAARGTLINSYRAFASFGNPGYVSLAPSSYFVVSNDILLSAPGPFGADAIVAADWLSRERAEIPNAGVDRWNVRDNDIVLPIRGRGISIIGDRGHTIVARNRFWGGPQSEEGIVVHESTGTRTDRNSFPLWPARRHHVHIGSTSGFATVIEPDNIVLDLGVNDHVEAREVRRTPP